MPLFNILLILLLSFSNAARSLADAVDLDVCEIITVVETPVIIKTYVTSNTAIAVDSTYSIYVTNAPTSLDTTFTIPSTLTPETDLPAPTESATLWTTTTVYKTNSYTITSCAPTVLDCPAHIGQVTTETIIDYTTVCPITSASESSFAPNSAISITSNTPTLTSGIYNSAPATLTVLQASNTGIPIVSPVESTINPSPSSSPVDRTFIIGVITPGSLPKKRQATHSYLLANGRLTSDCSKAVPLKIAQNQLIDTSSSPPSIYSVPQHVEHEKFIPSYPTPSGSVTLGFFINSVQELVWNPNFDSDLNVLFALDSEHVIEAVFDGFFPPQSKRVTLKAIYLSESDCPALSSSVTKTQLSSGLPVPSATPVWSNSSIPAQSASSVDVSGNSLSTPPFGAATSSVASKPNATPSSLALNATSSLATAAASSEVPGTTLAISSPSPAISEAIPNIPTESREAAFNFSTITASFSSLPALTTILSPPTSAQSSSLAPASSSTSTSVDNLFSAPVSSSETRSTKSPGSSSIALDSSSVSISPSSILSAPASLTISSYSETFTDFATSSSSDVSSLGPSAAASSSQSSSASYSVFLSSLQPVSSVADSVSSSALVLSTTTASLTYSSTSSPNSTVVSVISQTTTSTPYSATSSSTSCAVPPPGYAPPSTTTDCCEWYTVKTNDNCDKVDALFGITFAEFQYWNPSIDPDCFDLELGTAYCVSVGPKPSSSTTTSLPTIITSINSTSTNGAATTSETLSSIQSVTSEIASSTTNTAATTVSSAAATTSHFINCNLTSVITNGGFEDSQTNVDPWVYENPVIPFIASGPGYPNSGDNALLVYKPALNATDIWSLNQTVTICPSTPYIFSFYTRANGDNSTTAECPIEVCFNDDCQELVTLYDYDSTYSQYYRLFDGRPANTTSLNVSIASPACGQYVFLDDISFNATYQGYTPPPPVSVVDCSNGTTDASCRNITGCYWSTYYSHCFDY